MYIGPEDVEDIIGRNLAGDGEDGEGYEDEGEADAEPPPAAPLPEPRPRVAPSGTVVIPILAGDESGEVTGPFYRVDSRGMPLLDVYERVATREGANAAAKWGRGPHLDFVTAEIDEAGILEAFGPGHYWVAIRGANGRFLRGVSVSVGRVAASPVGRAGRREPQGLGALGAPQDAAPAWAQGLLSRIDGLEAKLAARPGADLNGLVASLNAIDEQMNAVDRAHASLAKVRERWAPPQTAPKADEDDDEEDLSFFDGVDQKLGEIANPTINAKARLEQMALVFGSASST